MIPFGKDFLLTSSSATKITNGNGYLSYHMSFTKFHVMAMREFPQLLL